MKIDLVNETGISIRKTDVTRWIEEELLHQHRETDVEVEVMVVASDKIRRLNKKHRRKDSVTDVLSFPLFDKIYSSNETRSSHLSGSNNIKPPAIHLGTIVLCPECAIDDMEFLVRHCVKHLIGIHHPE